jgi:hypothetical protein
MSFHQIPRELRDVIYDYYISQDAGYYFDSNSGRLRCLSGEHIDLSLMYTCKTIAVEMRGVAFKNNAIHFNTAQITGRCTPRTRHFGHLLEEIYIARISILPHARPFITNFVADKVIELFPQSENLIRHLQTTTEKKCRHYEQLDRFEEWDLAPSIHREAVAELLWRVAENPVFSQVTRRALSLSLVSSSRRTKI